MNLPKVHSKIFWPSHCMLAPSGYVVGWNIRSFIICVVTVVSGVEREELERVLNKIYQDRGHHGDNTEEDAEGIHKTKEGNGKGLYQNINTAIPSMPWGEGPPKILGVWFSEAGIGNESEWNIKVPDVHDVDIWVTLEQDHIQYPRVREICCYGYRYQNGSRWTSSQIIFYTQPQDYFYSMRQLVFDSDANCECLIPATELEATLRQINCSKELERIILSTIAMDKSHAIPETDKMNRPTLPTNQSNIRNRRAVSASTNTTTNTNTNANTNITTSTSSSDISHPKQTLPMKTSTSSIFHKFFCMVIFCMRLFCTIILYMLEHTGLQQYTLTGKQLHHRLAVLSEYSLDSLTSLTSLTSTSLTLLNPLTSLISLTSSPARSSGPHKPSTTKPPNESTKIHYDNCTWPAQLRKWNARWLGVNDIVMGVVAGIIVYRNHDLILECIQSCHKVLTDNVLRNLIQWLMGWPAGFKLNENLDKFLGLLFLYYIDKWTIVTEALFTHCGNAVITLISLSGLFGVSVMVSMILDLVSFLTAHITCFYYIAARFHHLELVVLSSLWKLFRGLKYNPLKNRIDSSNYEFDQLLLGTVLLTLLVFLFPTTAVYYIFFTSLRLVLISLQGLGMLALELLNHFPLYHLVIYFMHPELLPSGIRFAVVTSNNTNLNLASQNTSVGSTHTRTAITPNGTNSSPNTTYLMLESQPVPMGALFFHLSKFISEILRKYTIGSIIGSFITGEQKK